MIFKFQEPAGCFTFCLKKKSMRDPSVCSFKPLLDQNRKGLNKENSLQGQKMGYVFLFSFSEIVKRTAWCNLV